MGQEPDRRGLHHGAVFAGQRRLRGLCPTPDLRSYALAELLSVGRTLFPNCRYLIARPDRREVLRDASILIDGRNIVAVGSGREIEAVDLGDPTLDIVDCGDKIVMPGLVHGHNHSPWSVVNLVFSAAS